MQAVWGQPSIKDEEIIPWVGQQDGVWVHADDSAKKDNRELLLANSISTLWVRRPKTGMSGASQLRAVAYVVEDFLERKRNSRRPIHYRLIAHGQPGKQRIRLEPYQL